ncbi:hypothetical protein psal_cds_750 [Pandoravirus salinus]|uniref:Uncharacterized protein n=1 Tax=Pandoravirus salinus TaxID=1349410 RepID=S4VZ16_9VIRU|nr:hypothetical protein psal_cds_750 [Pandoravirus salinus]AGO84736.1 hypothetical protein psal_cds_750 [Pandoravirus salinus]
MADTEVECPVCKHDDRAFYVVPNNNIILMCDECTSIWLDPARPRWGQSANDRTLRAHFGVTDVQQLFVEPSSGWATRREVCQDRKWRGALDRIGCIKTDMPDPYSTGGSIDG